MFELQLCERYSKEWQEPCFLAIGRFSDYDFCSQSRKYSVEIKYESSPVRTGNLCFEYWNSSLNEPSGILSTRASIWLHCIDYEGEILCLEFEINKLRRYIIELGTIKHNENAIFKIIPLEQIRKYVKREFTIPKVKYIDK